MLYFKFQMTELLRLHLYLLAPRLSWTQEQISKFSQAKPIPLITSYSLSNWNCYIEGRKIRFPFSSVFPAQETKIPRGAWTTPRDAFQDQTTVVHDLVIGALFSTQLILVSKYDYMHLVLISLQMMFFMFWPKTWDDTPFNCTLYSSEPTVAYC